MGVDVVLGVTMLLIYTLESKMRLGYSLNDECEDIADISLYLEVIETMLIEDLQLG